MTKTRKYTKIPLKDYLQQKRKAANLSQRDVADKLGYQTPQFISNWERGVACPPVKDIKTIANLYMVSAEEIFQYILDDTTEKIAANLRKKFKND